MMFLKRFNYGNEFKRILSIVICISFMAALLPISPRVSAAETTVQSVITDYLPTIAEVIDASGFKHPGVGLTKDILENVRAQVRAQKEPWNTYFNQMLLSAAAAKNVTSSNQSGADPTKPASNAFNSQGFNSRFIADGLKAYTQALLYVITGDEVYRANAMRIIRIWEQMDPAKYVYFTDSHIHTGIPLNRMTTAAEILRYTSTENPSLAWTDKDTADFTNNLINPVIETFQHTNYRFMNQHLYSLLGAMSGYIFTGNRDRYNEGVEWFTVNKTAVDQGQNGAIKALFRLVDTNALTGEPVDPPVVQHVEMGRDQAHGAGDITNVEIISRLLLAQGTKVDPVDGTASTAPDAVGPYEFLDNRILKAADLFARFMIGYDTPWIPVAAHTDANGNPTIIYKDISGAYRGRIGGNVYDLYYYYKYTAGVNMAEAAPYFTEMFAKRLPFYWESPDGGADYWLFIPKEAEAEGAQYLPKPVSNPDLREVENRYTRFDGNSATKQEGDTSFVQFTATEEGSKIALVASSTGSKTIGFRIRTNGTAKLEVIGGIGDTITLPDTMGQWRYVTYTMNNFQFFGDLVYFKVKGSGTTVDLDHVNVNAGAQLTPPVFSAGNAPLKLFAYVGSEAPVKFDFTAADPNATDVVTYQIDNKPEGAVLSESTGVFSWTPTEAGTYSFVVGASDGTTVTTKDVTVIVTDDRESAVAAVITPYNPSTNYISSTLERYKVVYTDVMSAINSSADEVFYQKLVGLSNAVQGLQLLTPLLSDGSMNYLNMFASSTFGNAVPNLLDNGNGSFVCFCWAQNLTYYMDFGPDFKVSANAFGLQVRASFPERIGGVAVFGSNNKVNWTRLTPGLTTVTEDMQKLDVEDSLKDEQFRFLKIQMIEPATELFPGAPMIEPAEFRIFGERHEMVTQIPGTIAEALAEAEKLPDEDYTKQSYYLFQKELEYVKSSVGNPDYNEQELINEIYDARSLLVPYTTSLYSFEGNANNSFGFSTSTGGTVIGAAAYPAGKVGQAISLNGTDSYVVLPATQPMSGYNEMTLATWVYWNGSSQWQRIFDFGNNTNQYMFLTPRSGNNTLRFSIKNGSEQFVETAQLPVGQWSHVAVTLGNGTAKLYVNGVLKAAKTGITIKPGDFQPGTNYIGKSQFSDPLFSGMVDEFRIYNRVLSDGEIGAVYNQTGYGNDNSLLKFLLEQAAAAGNAGIYTADSVHALQQEIPSAQAVASDSGASQAEVDAAADRLRGAYEGLVYLPGVPAIAPVADKTVIAGNQLSFKLHQLNSVTGTVFSVSGLPQGAVFDPDKRTVAWTPARTQGGVYTLTLTAAAEGGSTSRTVKLTVKGDPVIAPGGTVELKTRQAFTYQVKATDPTGAALTYSAAKLPSGAAFDPVTGIFTWTPAPANYGDNFAIFTVSNGLFTVSQTVAFKVSLGLLMPDGYTKGSYYLYKKEAERIQAALALPDADKAALIQQLAQAESLLVPASTLPAAKVAVTSSMVTASTVVWPDANAGSAAQNGWRAFDGNTGTYTDTTANPSWILVDLGADNARSIGSVKFYPRTNFVSRVKGSIIQGSNDGMAWTDLYTINGITAAAWNTASITNATAFNYLRFYSPAGNSNVAELEFYDKPIDKTLLPILLEEAGAVDTGLYKEESIQALQAEVKKAQEVYSNEAAAQPEIDSASARLIAALKGLQWKDVTVSVDPAAPGGKNGWYTSPVTVTMSPAAIAEYSLDGGVTWAVYGAPVTLAQEGTHQVQYRRSVDSGEANKLEIKIDRSAPVVQIMGSASYTIDQTVSITCSATDVISSVYGTPCGQPLVQAKAYSLPAGQNTVTITAEDMAGHQTTAAHTFTVTVTFDSLKTVTNSFLKATGTKEWDTVVKSLNQKLDQAKAAAGSGRIDAAKSMMADYIGQVTDQTGKFFTGEQADILIRWARIVI
ncbi:putative Ig domain-containing protein [Paenibacillus sp. sptzw28]|uniref:LamG-like jellyroll fold domain-containing protein n=1 Tax=Paenibacillus sp. sptzw28 TaxID=715179 RepID=UPI001C6E30F5|nr:LamG-like jellyroll fold domain-containing protein [Paenibacillus sp. sptzw28]QYR19338.1 putative Ig domain-containing protein [Paenibacillus sp. sptzw28]